MKTTILLYTYNGEQFLQSQLDSFLRQTKLPDYISIIDDCSTDETSSILQNFQISNDLNIDIIRNNKHVGKDQSILKLLLETEADLIFLANQDDIWWANRIEEFYRVFDRDPYLALVFSNAELIDENGFVFEKDHFSQLRLMDKWDNLSPDLTNFLMKNNSFVDGSFMVISSKVRKKLLHFYKNYPNFKENISYDQFLAQFIALSFPNDFVRELLKVTIKHRKDKKSKNLNRETRIQKIQFLADNQLRLKKLSGLASLIVSDHEKIPVIKKAISFTKKRMKIHQKSSRLERLVFILKHLLSFKYKKFTQYPFKEILRDFL